MLADMVVFLMVLGFVAIVAVLIVAGSMMEKKRREALSNAAIRLGLSYNPETDRALGKEYEFLNALRQGDNRFAFDVMQGSYREHAVLVFGYHYETESTDSKGNRTTHNHHLNVYTVAYPRAFPELTIVREGFFSKIAQVFGYDDIDFESHEFSKTFCVRSKDKKFAYDICHPQAMEFLLANKDLNIEIEGDRLGFVFEGKPEPQDLEGNLLRLVQFRNMVPDYLVAKGSG